MQQRNFVVLGASGGIGSETCRRLHADGANVLLAGRNAERLEELSVELDLPFRSLDATSLEEVEACVQQAIAEWEHVDGVVNCVGSVLLKPAHLTTMDEWHHTIATNLTSSFALVRVAAKAMRKRGGSIVLMSSAAAQVGLANHEAIAAAKAGVEGLARSAAATYASAGVRINAVAPGLVKTPLTARIWNSEKTAEFSRNMHALGRLGEPSDVASLIVWLLSAENSWVSGQVFGVDGGLAKLRPAGK